MRYRIILTLFVILFLTTPVYAEYEIEKDENGNTVIKAGDEEFYVIPPAIEVTLEENRIFFDNKGKDTEFKFKNQIFFIKKKSKLEFQEDSQRTVIKLDGEGDLNLNGNLIYDVKDAEFVIEADQISYAKFSATEEQRYYFHYDEKQFIFDVDEGGEVIYNPKEGVIEGEKAVLNYEGNTVTGIEYGKFKLFLEETDLSNENNAIIILEGKIKAKGKVVVETDSFSYGGLTDSSEFDYEIKNGEEFVSITSNEDRSKEEGGIARFIKRYNIGDLKTESGFVTEGDGVEMIISRENGKNALHLNQFDLGILGEIERDFTVFALVDSNFNLQVGEDSFKIDSEFGMEYITDNKEPIRILSPQKTHLYLGDDLSTVKGIVESQVEYNEPLNSQLLGIQKIYELGKEEQTTSEGTIRFESSLNSFEDTKRFIQETYGNSPKGNVALNYFMLNNLDNIKADFTESRGIWMPNSAQSKKIDSFISSTLSEIKTNLESQDYLNYEGDLNLLTDSVSRFQSEGLSVDEIKEILTKGFQNKVRYEDLSRQINPNYKYNVDSLREFINLEKTQINEIEGGFEIVMSDFGDISDREAVLREKLAFELVVQDRLGEGLNEIDSLMRDLESNKYKLMLNEEGIITPDYERLISTDLLNEKLKRERIAMAEGGFGRIALDILTQQGKISEIQEKWEGGLDKLRDNPMLWPNIGKIKGVDPATEALAKGTMTISAVLQNGGYGRDIMRYVKGGLEIDSNLEYLDNKNRNFAKGVHAIDALYSFGIDGDVIEKWVNDDLDKNEYERIANQLLIRSERFESEGNPESYESNVDPATGNSGASFENSVYLKYSDVAEVLEFFENSREDARNIYYSGEYGSGIRKLIGTQEIGYEGFSVDSLTRSNFEQTLEELEPDSKKVAYFVDEVTNPMTLVIGGGTGFTGMTIGGVKGTTGALMNIGENLLVDAVTGKVIVDKRLEGNPNAQMIASLAVPLGTSFGLNLGGNMMTSSIQRQARLNTLSENLGLDNAFAEGVLKNIDLSDTSAVTRVLRSNNINVLSSDVEIALGKLNPEVEVAVLSRKTEEIIERSKNYRRIVEGPYIPREGDVVEFVAGGERIVGKIKGLDLEGGVSVSQRRRAISDEVASRGRSIFRDPFEDSISFSSIDESGFLNRQIVVSSEKLRLVDKAIPLKSPTKIIQEVDSPHLESTFYRKRGLERGSLMAEASIERTPNSVTRKHISNVVRDLRSEDSRQINPDNILGAKTVLHTHPDLGDNPFIALPSNNDLRNLLQNKDLRTSIIAVTDANSGVVKGYLVIRKSSDSNRVLRHYRTSHKLITMGDGHSLPPIIADRVETRFGRITNSENYFSAIDELGDKVGFNYRYVPNRNAGYEFDSKTVQFVRR